MDALNSQDRLITRLSSRIEHLDKAVRNITGLPEDEDEYTATPLVHTCKEIKTNWPDSPSDYYTIADSNGHTRHVYCRMEELCGSDEGWMRVTYLNMSDPSEQCPEGFRLHEKNGVRACGRPSTTSGSCISTHQRINFILMILSGMVKDVVVLRNHVVGFLVFLGFIRLWDILPLTILR